VIQFRHIVLTPRGWVATKAKYGDKEVAKSWTSFVKAAWHGMPVKVIEVTEKNIKKFGLNKPETN
jgi:hypothetical protein